MAFDLVFFGGTGDLVWRKLMPALFQAFRHGTLPEGGRIIGVGRDALTDEQYRQNIQAKFANVEGEKRPSTQEFERFAALLCYVRMDLSRPEDYALLKARLAERQTDTVVMYLSTAPTLFTTIGEQLAASGLNGQSFAFHGYLPTDASERANRLRQLEQRSRQEKQTQIFIETPYRNEALLEAMATHCAAGTLISIATDLTLDSEFVRTLPASAWKREFSAGRIPEFRKKPTVFLMLA